MKSPMFFTKGRSALTGHNKPIKILTRHGRTIPEPEPVVVFKDTVKLHAHERLHCKRHQVWRRRHCTKPETGTDSPASHGMAPSVRR
jgi:hypothetical protein